MHGAMNATSIIADSKKELKPGKKKQENTGTGNKEAAPASIIVHNAEEKHLTTDTTALRGIAITAEQE